MDAKLNKVTNGYIVEITGERDGEFFEETHVFTRLNPALKFMRDFLTDAAKSN